MNVRLIKPDTRSRQDEPKQPPVQVPIIDTIQSWVREFQSTKANKTRLDFERISNPGR